MADLSDATSGLASAVLSTLGLAAGSIFTPTGNVIKVYPGWPDSATLQADLALGSSSPSSAVCHVSVFAKPLDTQQFVAMTDMGWTDGALTDGQGTVERTLRRQTKVFAISVWANTPAIRDSIAAAIDAGLVAIIRLTLDDGSLAPLAYKGSLQRDEQQKVMIYRRDLNYALTFDLVQSQTGYAVKAAVVNITGGNPEDLGPPDASYNASGGMPQPSADFSSQWNSSIKTLLP